MDNLAQRFASFDAVPVPDLWAEVTRRAEASTATAVGAPTVGLGRGGAKPLPSLLRMAVIAGALVAALALGAFVGGLLLPERNAPLVTSPSVPPTADNTAEPSPAGDARCVQMQQSAARTATGWPTGAPPESTPQNGWIAAWTSDDTPAVVLIDAAGGQTCELIRFEHYSAPRNPPQPDFDARDWIPARGTLTWSPNGEALAIEVVSSVNDQPPGHDLYIWSQDGLLGPIAWPQIPATMDGIAWAPGGSWLAATNTSHTVEPSTEASILIADAHGARNDIDLDCGKPCWADRPLISPDGSSIATVISGMGEQSGARLISWSDIALVDVATREVQHLASSQELLARHELVGWSGPGELLLMDNEGRFVGVPIAAPTQTIDYGFDVPPDATADVLNVSPDGSGRMQLDTGGPDESKLIASQGFDDAQVIATLDSPWGPVWWSPDSSLIGYLIDVETANQGIWTIAPDGDRQQLLAPGAFVIDRDARHVWQPVWP